MHTLPLTLLPLLFLAPAIDGWLGVYLDNERSEAVVAEVLPDSPAARAGLQAGDELLAVGDVKTADREAFIAAIGAARPGDRLAIQLRRAGREQVVMVRLGTRPETVVTPTPTAPPPPARRGDRPVPAVEVAPAKAAAPAAPATAATGRGYLGVSVREDGEGVLVDRVLADGPAKDLLANGDRIQSINGQPVGGLEDLDRGLGRHGPGSKIELRVNGANGPRAVTITLGRRPGSSDAKAPSSGAKGEAAAVEIVQAPAPEFEITPVAPKPVANPGPGLTPAPAPASTPAPAAAGGEGARADGDLEAQLAALRAELAELRRQLEQLRRQGRE